MSRNIFLMLMSFTILKLSKCETNECETLPSTIHIIKEETDANGLVLRRCEENLAINKCEGACLSKVQPSVNTPSGFLKDCKCCKETRFRRRDFTLTNCYDSDGHRLDSGQLASLAITIKEPVLCRCFKCGDSTR